MKEETLQRTSRQLALARTLVYRLERLSADSSWAHQASGIRGSLLKSIDRVELNAYQADLERLDQLIHQGFHILENAAREL